MVCERCASAFERAKELLVQQTRRDHPPGPVQQELVEQIRRDYGRGAGSGARTISY
jgi:hypothetical protein